MGRRPQRQSALASAASSISAGAPSIPRGDPCLQVIQHGAWSVATSRLPGMVQGVSPTNIWQADLSGRALWHPQLRLSAQAPLSFPEVILAFKSYSMELGLLPRHGCLEWCKECLPPTSGKQTSAAERFGICSFVYQRRRPFHSQR